MNLNGSSTIKDFDFTILRDHVSKIKIEVSLYSNIACYDHDCTEFVVLDQVGAPWHSQWKAAWPNKFSPNGDGDNDFFHIWIRSMKENMIDCTDINIEKSSVYRYRLEIYDYWGNKMFDQTKEIPLTNTIGILGDEIKWDGYFNQQPVNPDTYTFKATIHSCYDGYHQCNNCGFLNSFQKCGTSAEEIFYGTVDVIL